jgi:dGTPase
MSSLLATYASDPARSRGRRFAEKRPSSEFRNEYQRDRDRIVHSSAFRRLVYKTQVFLNHEGDLFRTRMTHSLEVAQLGRSIARALGLHEDLVEAIALAHDLGHTPFGHAGQDALNEILREQAPRHHGFEHNLQSLRVVDRLEERYPEFDGLNLTFETRAGILKHCSASHAKRLEAREPDGVAGRFLNNSRPSLEAQLANLADEIAYNAHDIDDGVRSGLIDMDQLMALDLFASHYRQVLSLHPKLSTRRALLETIRCILSAQVHDAIEATRAALRHHGIESASQVAAAPIMVKFSEEMYSQRTQIKRWLLSNLYRHPYIVRSMEAAREVVRDLYVCYMQEPKRMPASYAQLANLPRATADYIAGMTDRYALREHARWLPGSDVRRELIARI